MRKEGSARELIRNETVNELIEKHTGSFAVLLENLSISEQVLLMKEAKVVIAPHGAGLTNCVHMNQG